MLNGGVTKAIPITKLVRQGHSLSPLLFAIVMHWILTMLHNLVAQGESKGLSLPSGQSSIVQAVTNDHIMLLGALCENIRNVVRVWD